MAVAALLLLLSVLILQILGLAKAVHGSKDPEPLVSWCSPIFAPFGIAVLDGNCNLYPIAQTFKKGAGCIMISGSQQMSWLKATVAGTALSLILEVLDIAILVLVHSKTRWYVHLMVLCPCTARFWLYTNHKFGGFAIPEHQRGLAIKQNIIWMKILIFTCLQARRKNAKTLVHHVHRCRGAGADSRLRDHLWIDPPPRDFSTGVDSHVCKLASHLLWEIRNSRSARCDHRMERWCLFRVEGNLLR